MRKARLLQLALLLVAAPVLAAKIQVDYDGATAFGEYQTFQFRETRKDLRRVSPSLHEWVARQVIGYARGGGLAMVPAQPDIYFGYYAAYRGQLRLVPEELEYAYGDRFTPGPHWGGDVGVRDDATNSFTFKEGTVIVDVWDRERGVLVWRGMATGALKRNYEENEVRLAKALQRLMKSWQEVFLGSAKAIRKLE
jgi:hypothetical protein